MSPTVRDARVAFELDAVTGHPVPRRAQLYALAVLALALVLVGALVLAGAEAPDPGLLLVLALPLALCMNRYLFFPNEVGVTADAAVIFAAMVAFRGDAQWLGPLVLALLAGPLDARHWGARAFTRMAYNSGSTTLVAAAGLVVFVPLTHELGSGWQAIVGASAIAAVPYFLSESILGVTLVTLLGERPRAAARHQVPLNALVLPLAVVGALAGLAAVGVGWWLALAVLLPVPFGPELVLVAVPRRLGVRRALDLVLALLGSCGLAVGVFAVDATVAAVATALALLCFVLIDNPPRRGVLFPPLGVVLVVVPVAACVGSPSTGFLTAIALGVPYLALVSITERRAWWSLPLVAGAAATAAAIESGAVVVIAAVVLAGAWGPLPWDSRYLGRFAGRRLEPTRWPLLLVVVVGANALTIGAVRSDGTMRTTLALLAIGVLELGVVASALAVRLWRFAPARRARDLIVLAVAAIAVVAVVLPCAQQGSVSAIVASLAISVAVACVAAPLAAPRS
jgi:hypothetical protein